MKTAAVRAVLIASLGTETPLASSRRVVSALAVQARRGEPASERTELLRHSLAKALGIQSQLLAPVADLITNAAAEGAVLSPAGFLDLIEAAANRLPEFFSPALAIDLAEALEAAMGTAALTGVRDMIREAKP